MPRELTKMHLDELRGAKNRLENPGIAAKITNLFGAPIERGFDLLPAKWSKVVNQAVQTSLQKALDVALITVDSESSRASLDMMHKIVVGVTGGTGGALGLTALSVELPISTTVMLRSIADIARSQGEQLKDPEARLNCLAVFALGGASKGDDATETGYFTIRTALAKVVSEAAQHIAEKGVAREGAPAIVRLIGQIAARFGVTVSEKAAAQAVPAVGAIGGASINVIFMDHFQEMARGHFTVRRLERTYGEEAVRQAYEKL